MTAVKVWAEASLLVAADEEQIAYVRAALADVLVCRHEFHKACMKSHERHCFNKTVEPTCPYLQGSCGVGILLKEDRKIKAYK